MHLQYAVVDVYNISGGFKIVHWEPGEPLLSKMESLETKAWAIVFKLRRALMLYFNFPERYNFFKGLLDQGPFCGATGTVCFGLWIALPLGFKARVNPSLPVLFCCLHTTIP